MITKEISSLQHPIIKYCVRLLKERSFRQEEGRVLISGNKLVNELGRGAPFPILFIEENSDSSLAAESTYRVTRSILQKITGLENPESLAAVLPLPPPADLSKKNYLIALDGISDPGNLGTLLRSALALGWEGVFITENSVDPFNDKALRAAKGATFHLPLRIGSCQELIECAEKNRWKAYIADAKGAPWTRHSPPLLLILGNEAKGVSPTLKNLFPSISIPMHSSAESLNVSAAGAILMHSLGPHEKPN